MEELVIDQSLVANQDLKKFDKCIRNQYSDSVVNYFYGNAGREHYKLMSYISYKYNNSLLLDIGTYRGLSALSLSSNPNTT